MLASPTKIKLSVTRTMWLTAAELSRLFKVPVGTVYRWAHEDHWRRTEGRPVYYDARAAVSSHKRRHAARFLADKAG